MNSYNRRVFSKTSNIYSAPMTAKSPCRGPNRGIYNSCSNPAKTGGLWHPTHAKFI